MHTEWADAAEILAGGGVGVLPTDTLYGLVASALDPDAVERVFDLKQRDHGKPPIVLISDIAQLEQFGVVLSEVLTEKLHTYWPGPYSIILPSIDEQFEYLYRGTGGIAFRLPDSEALREVIDAVGPLIAPSANPEGMPPAGTIEEAKVYFGSDVSFYVDGGELRGKPSTLIRLEGDEVVTLRG